jgi:hypothetical protein
MKKIYLIFLILLLSTIIKTFQPDTKITWEECSDISPKARKIRKMEKKKKNLFKKNFFDFLIPSEFKFDSNRHKNLKKLFKLPEPLITSPSSISKKNYDDGEKIKKKNFFVKGIKNFFKIKSFDDVENELIEKKKKNENEKSGFRSSTHSVNCAKIKVPLFWDDTSSGEFVYSFVKRFRNRSKDPKGALFLLQVFFFF